MARSVSQCPSPWPPSTAGLAEEHSAAGSGWGTRAAGAGGLARQGQSVAFRQDPAADWIWRVRKGLESPAAAGWQTLISRRVSAGQGSGSPVPSRDGSFRLAH